MTDLSMLTAEPGLDIRHRLAVAKLPTMPQILVKLMEYCQSEDTGLPDLADLISKDAAMTAKIFRVVNSSGFHRSGSVASLEKALMVIGINLVKTLLISESVFQMFDKLAPFGGDLRNFWKHSLTTAVTARLIADKMGEAGGKMADKMADISGEEAYLAGLLHDVGRLALLAILPKEYANSFHAPDDEGLCALEQRTLQITHAEAGAWLIEHWKLDSFLADSVLYHHDPVARLENAPRLVRIVCLAHRLSLSEPHPELDAAAALCRLTVADLESISVQAAEQVALAAKYLGIDLDVEEPAAAQPAPSATDVSRERLGAQMRNLILGSELERTWAKGSADGELLESIARSALILFDFNDATLLLVDDSGQFLHGTATGVQRQRLAELSIALADKGLIAEAALQRRVTMVDGAQHSLSIPEEQLRRILDAECLVFLPLGNKDRCTGVLVGGAQAWQLDDLKKRTGFLELFCTHAANALNAAARAPALAGADLARLAEQYQQASKRVAHEVNNPLGIIKNYLSVLDRKLARQEPIGGELSILNEEIDRVGRLVHDFAESNPLPSAAPTEINEVIDQVVQLFSSTEYLPPSVEIEVGRQDEACQVDGDVGALKQILMNLIKNAVEALPDGGRIEIANRGVINRDGRLYVELWITDSGAGIPAAMMSNLFAPVRSAKGGPHRGLGLSIVHSLVTQMQGVIHCRSGKKGTTFELLLPVARSTADQLPQAGRTQIRKPV